MCPFSFSLIFLLHFIITTPTYRDIVLFAREKGIHIHTHLAEDEEEIEYMLNRYGKRSLAWAQDIGMIGSDVWYAHGNYFNEEELKAIGNHGVQLPIVLFLK